MQCSALQIAHNQAVADFHCNGCRVTELVQQLDILSVRSVGWKEAHALEELASGAGAGRLLEGARQLHGLHVLSKQLHLHDRAGGVF